MKTISSLVVGLMVVIQAIAQPTAPLRYNGQGTFKIAQFTDIHFNAGVEKAKPSIALINNILDTEQPQLVIFTGDIVTSKPVLEGWDEVLAPAIQRKIPWAVIFGNHDDENGMSREAIMEYITKKPYCMAQRGPETLTSVGNYVLKVTDANDKNLLLLYCMDSRAYSTIEGLKGYGWFGFDQIEWYRKQSAAFADGNGGKPLPALAFFHIPLNEYTELSTSSKPFIIGTRSENECPGTVNTGMYAAMLERGDVMGTFVGHDHDNDYIGILNGICLAYGRFSGTTTTYTNLQHGSRIIEAKASERSFKSWIRLADGSVINSVQYPESFTKKK